ncbi:MAG: hypothetical protein K2W96_17725, partial [Gemmataceae bacterium]|nr:hypothetical protein [Gemmataceae bacterium]
PEGKVLGSHAKQAENPKKYAEEVLEVIAAAKPKGLPARRPAPFDALADRGVGVRKDGSLALAVYLRPMVLGLDKRGIGDLAVDSIVLSEEEAGHFGAEGAKAGAAWGVPSRVVRKLHKVLSPGSDANALAKEGDVTRASLRAKVEKVLEGVAYARFTGEIAGQHEWQFDPHKGKKIRGEAVLRGVGTFDARTGKPTRIVIVATGTHRMYAPYDEPTKYGAVVDWKRTR